MPVRTMTSVTVLLPESKGLWGWNCRLAGARVYSPSHFRLPQLKGGSCMFRHWASAVLVMGFTACAPEVRPACR